MVQLRQSTILIIQLGREDARQTSKEGKFMAIQNILSSVMQPMGTPRGGVAGGMQALSDRIREQRDQQEQRNRVMFNFLQGQEDRKLRLEDRETSIATAKQTLKLATDKRVQDAKDRRVAKLKKYTDVFVKGLGEAENFIDPTKKTGAQSYTNYPALEKRLKKEYGLTENDDVFKHIFANVHRDMTQYYAGAPDRYENFSEIIKPNALFKAFTEKQLENVTVGDDGISVFGKQIVSPSTEYSPPSGNNEDPFTVKIVE